MKELITMTKAELRAERNELEVTLTELENIMLDSEHTDSDVDREHHELTERYVAVTDTIDALYEAEKKVALARFKEEVINELHNNTPIIGNFEILEVKRDSMHKDDWFCYIARTRNIRTGDWSTHLINIEREFSTEFGNYFDNTSEGKLEAMKDYERRGVSSSTIGYNEVR